MTPSSRWRKIQIQSGMPEAPGRDPIPLCGLHQGPASSQTPNTWTCWSAATASASCRISMVCSKYDCLEHGTPTYEERLQILKTVSRRVQRTIVRIQPYMHEVRKDVLDNLPRVAEAGAHGVVLEGMKFAKKKPGLVRIGGDCVYPIELLRAEF